MGETLSGRGWTVLVRQVSPGTRARKKGARVSVSISWFLAICSPREGIQGSLDLDRHVCEWGLPVDYTRASK